VDIKRQAPNINQSLTANHDANNPQTMKSPQARDTGTSHHLIDGTTDSV
jgi:hypothetical protein